jgi:hypothetical protein
MRLLQRISASPFAASVTGLIFRIIVHETRFSPAVDSET